jgi:hypothetical protein
MSNELISEKSWWKRNWNWVVGCLVLLIVASTILFNTKIIGVGADITKAYLETSLYTDALQKAQADKRVSEILGTLQPIDKLSILEGAVTYTDSNQRVSSTIRVEGTKGKAKMDIKAQRVQNIWKYNQINIRIKNPSQQIQTIEIDTTK